MAKIKVNKGQKIPEECLGIAQKALSLFDHDELREYVSLVLKKADEFKELPSQQAIQKAIADVNDQTKAILLDRVATKVNNIQKFDARKLDMDNGANLRNTITRTRTNKGNNIRSSIESSKQQLREFIFNRLTQKEIEDFRKGTMDKDIASEYDGEATGNETAKKIAQAQKDYFNFRTTKEIDSNAMPIEHVNPRRLFRNPHNPSKMRTGGRSLVGVAMDVGRGIKMNEAGIVNQWVSKIKNSYDMEASFPRARNVDGSMNEEKLDKILTTMYDNIVNDSSKFDVRSTVANDREAVARKSRMVLIPKGMRDFMEYNQQYGKGSLFDCLLSDIESSGNSIGRATMFGDNPVAMFKDLERYQDKIRPVSDLYKTLTAAEFKEVMSIDKRGTMPTVGTFFRAKRAITSMSRLFFLPAQSLGDLAQVAGVGMRYGMPFWDSYGYAVRNSFNALSKFMGDTERQAVAKDLQLSIRNHIGYMASWADSSDPGELSHKMSNLFFKANGTSLWDYGNKLSSTTLVSRSYGRQSKLGFDQLNTQARRQLTLHNISPEEWDAVRVKTKGKNFLLDNVNELSPEEVRSAWEKSDKTIPLSRYKDQLYNKVFSLFDVASENAVLNPSDFENLIGSWGTKADTLPGEVIRDLMQFKKYVISSVNRTWINGLHDMDSTQAKLMYGISLVAGTIPLQLASIWLGNAARGLTMPKFDEMNYGEKLKMALEAMAPGLGIFLRLFDPHEKNPHDVLGLFTSPSIMLMADPLYAAKGLVTGDFDLAGKAALDTLKNLSPISTVPFVEPYMNALLGKQPHLQPGQEQRQLFGL